MHQPSITILTMAPARTADGRIQLDRKFHTGVLSYVDLLDYPVRCLVPRGAPNSLDIVELAPEELPYEVAFLDEPDRVDQYLRHSVLLYGMNLELSLRAWRSGVPYVMVAEYNWSVRRSVATLAPKSAGRRWGPARQARRLGSAARAHVRETMAMLGARSVHCNGYPAYSGARLARRRLLYFDSRMSGADLATDTDLATRFASYGERPTRLVYSGRFEPIKGTIDVIEAARHLVGLHARFVLDMYGDGSLRPEMLRLIARLGLQERVRLHAPVPFSELMDRVKQADLFVCGHVQGDPSCTYLETLGAGVPIVGYGNEMWGPLARTSEAGIATPMSSPEELAVAVSRVVGRPARLQALSKNARGFAVSHTFESEFRRRVDDLKAVIDELTPQVPTAAR